MHHLQRYSDHQLQEGIEPQLLQPGRRRMGSAVLPTCVQAHLKTAFFWLSWPDHNGAHDRHSSPTHPACMNM